VVSVNIPIALGGVGAAGLLVITAVLGAATTSQASPGGYGTGLAAGTVPAPYVQDVLAAGSLCAAAPPSIIAAQIEAESNWNPRAVSPAGAQGIAQFMPGTWITWGADANGDGTSSPFDPGDAIPAQGHYDCALAAQIQAALKAGSVHGQLTDLMLAAYNAGPGAVLSAGGMPQIPETLNYVAKITARAAHYADTTATAAPAGSFAAAEIAAASSQLGVPYSWGGGNFTGPTLGVAQGAGTVGFDCSGLVLYAVYQASGGVIKLPHLADTQVVDATRLGGRQVPIADMQPGDLIAFRYPGAPTYHHIGIYLGNNQMLNAPSTGENVKISNIDSAYWKNQQWLAARYS
jgi:cell wall-associated NlpC family hydrolase